ncbi:hypothetical protein ACFQH3_09270 [Haladaptatus sp. GCM10025707]|uniref:DUF7546 family protein n=1 Tax=unclassified Haladaptatus TaxID=2622732 RepID=UPI00361CAA04
MGALLVNTELLLVIAYLQVSDAQPTLASLKYYIYPWVWINVSLWALIRTTPAPTSPEHRRLAKAVAVGYFVVLGIAGGIVGPASGLQPTGLRLAVLSIPPGWGPALLYGGEAIRFALMPYNLLGYLALAYLVYATVIDAASSAITGILGLLSCVSCSWPILASIVSGFVGSSTAIAGAVYAQSYGLSTAVFVVTVGLLYWRPFGR